jgi:N-acetyl-gamma-glutamyl-phosphate reductase
MKAAVLGATGYAGALLVRILMNHPDITSLVAVSRSQVGTAVRAFDPGLDPSVLAKLDVGEGRYVDYETAQDSEPDVLFSALPHLTSAELCAPFVGRSVVIDLSADFRHRSEERFQRGYGHPRPAAELQGSAVYGLSEWAREAIAAAPVIGNPGCYPTATLLPLLPLLKQRLIGGDIIVNALSGISGAGRKEKTNLLFCERTENVNAYNPGTTHRHVSEISEQLEGQGIYDRLLFTPHLVPIGRGMAVTTVASLRGTRSDVLDCLAQAYAERPFVVLTGDRIPETKHVRGTNRCDIGLRVEGDRLMLFSVIDNLFKGASGQAVQNMNIRLGLPETAGLSAFGEV